MCMGVKNNKHNLQWPKERVQAFINNVFEYVRDNGKCTTLVKAIVENDQYEAILRYFKTLDYELDFTPIKKAETIIKSRLIEKGLAGEFNPAITIFCLKNNHGMVDKKELKVEEVEPIKISIDKSALSDLDTIINEDN